MADIDYSAAQNVVYRFQIHVKRKRRVAVRIASKYIVYTERFGTRRSGYRVLYRIDKVNHFHKIINHTRLEFFRRYRYVVTALSVTFGVSSQFFIVPCPSAILPTFSAIFFKRITFYRNRIAYVVEEEITVSAIVVKGYLCGTVQIRSRKFQRDIYDVGLSFAFLDVDFKVDADSYVRIDNPERAEMYGNVTYQAITRAVGSLNERTKKIRRAVRYSALRS